MTHVQVQNWLLENGYGKVVSSHPVGGGCINNGAVLTTASGDSFFLKSNPDAAKEMFAREAEGLDELRVPGGPRIPQSFLFGQDYFLMEDLSPAPPREDYWTVFGRQLAMLHTHIQRQFGFKHDNYLGRTPQPNPWTEDGYAFFREQRLNFQARLAEKRGFLSKSEARQVEALSNRLPQLVPFQPASLLHGDLWSGNAITDHQGVPAIIDPAVYYGWAEAELAMTDLFGAFPAAFYSAYQEVRPLEAGFKERFPLYNLYHLLNHLNLFGRSYLSSVLSILRKYQ